jgi:hypothetical protein
MRSLEICEHLKDMPVGLQYDSEIWNEYFMSQVQKFQNKMKFFKSQFEQLEGFFKANERDNMEDSQSECFFHFSFKL